MSGILENGGRKSSFEVNVLLITDDEETRSRIARLLEPHEGVRATLTHAVSSTVGPHRVGDPRPDVVLADCPAGTDQGRETVCALLAGGCDSPVIVLAASNDASFYNAVVDGGAADCLVKPDLSTPLLEHAIRRAVRSRQAQMALKSRLDFQELVMTLATKFGSLDFDEVDTGIHNALKTIGGLAGADRSYVFQFREDGVTADNTHEWCAEGVEPLIDQLRGMSMEWFPWGMKKIRRGEPIHVPRVADMPPEAQAEKRIEQSQGIQSFVVVPMIAGDRGIGFLGLDAMATERTWPDEIIALLKVAGRSIANTLVRKRMELARQTSEERFRDILEHSRDVAYRLDLLTDSYEYVSPSVVNHTGYTAGEFISMGAAGFERLLHPQDRDRLFQLYQAYHEDPAQNPIPPVLEYRLRHKNGEYRWFSDGFTIIKDGQGRDIAEVGTFRDVTDEKRTENALKESEARYRRITESVTDYIYTVWVKDGHAVETVHGAGCVAVTGYAPLDFWQNPQLWIGMVHPDDRLVVLQQTDDILSGRSYEHIEHRIVRKDGVTRWVRNTPVPCRNADGNLISYDGLISDITERKETEDALRESEERYRKVVEDAYDGICVIQDGVMRFVNPELAAILGYPLETMVGASFRQYVHPDTTEAVLRMYEAFLHGTKPPRAYEGLLRHRDGNPIEAEISGSRIVYEGRGAALITLRDVTERNKTQRLLAEQQRAVAAASRLWSLGMMAGGVAHEINNPLAIISGSAEQLRDLLAWEPVDRRRALDQAEKILRHTQRIAAIIKGLRAFAQDGSADPFKEVSLQSIVNEALDMCRGRFTAHNIRLTVAPIPEGLRLECRPTQLSQVLLNLLSNAHDAVEKLPDRWVDIQVEDSGEYIHLAVIDSGAGMVEEIREKALQPFFTTKTVGKGMGLGLSISLGIIQNHRGTLRIDAEGPNTRVVVRVPKRQPSWPTEGGGTDG